MKVYKDTNGWKLQCIRSGRKGSKQPQTVYFSQHKDTVFCLRETFRRDYEKLDAKYADSVEKLCEKNIQNNIGDRLKAKSAIVSEVGHFWNSAVKQIQPKLHLPGASPFCIYTVRLSTGRSLFVLLGWFLGLIGWIWTNVFFFFYKMIFSILWRAWGIGEKKTA